MGTCFIVGIGWYSLYQSQVFLEGPLLTIDEPLSGTHTNTPLMHIRGLSKNTARLFLNDSQIFVNEEGVLDEKLLLLPGYTIISLRAEDKFGRIREEIIEVTLVEEPEVRPNEENISRLSPSILSLDA